MVRLQVTLSQNAFLGKGLAFGDGIKAEMRRLQSFACGRTRTGTEKPPVIGDTGGFREEIMTKQRKNVMPLGKQGYRPDNPRNKQVLESRWKK